jgi:hypothetical protein
MYILHHLNDRARHQFNMLCKKGVLLKGVDDQSKTPNSSFMNDSSDGAHIIR